jgi:hypothetical protein
VRRTGQIKPEDIRGYRLGEEFVCGECLNDEEREDLKGDNFLTDQGMDEEDFYFCDRCKKLL